MSSSSRRCGRFTADRNVHLDIIISPRCAFLTEKLLTATIRAVQQLEMEAADAGAAVKLSVTSIGSAMPSARTPESLYISSAHIACMQQLIPEEFFSNSSLPFFDYLTCTFGSFVDRDEVQSTNCLRHYDAPLSQQIIDCSARDDVITTAKAYARAFDDDYLPDLPLLYIDGQRYCNVWTKDEISSAICESAFEPAPNVRPSRDMTWPTPRVEFKVEQECPNFGERFTNDRGQPCLMVNDRNGVLVELVPVIGLLFLIISAFSLACLILFKRRVHQRARQLQSQQRTLQAAHNERIVDIMQFLALLASRDDSVDPSRHQAEVERHLNLLRTKSIEGNMGDTPTCTVCLEPVDVYYDLPCSHVFHKDCLRTWLDKGKSDCPVCRARIVADITPFSSSASAANPAENPHNVLQGQTSNANTTTPLASTSIIMI